MESDGGNGVSGKVVKEHVAGSLCFFSWRSLLIGDFVESCNDCGIAALGVVQEKSRDLLDSLDAGLVKERSEVGRCKLDFLTLDRSSPEMWCMLWTVGHWVAQVVSALGT